MPGLGTKIPHATEKLSLLQLLRHARGPMYSNESPHVTQLRLNAANQSINKNVFLKNVSRI